jgi:Tfp pilus assembly protein PilF
MRVVTGVLAGIMLLWVVGCVGTDKPLRRMPLNLTPGATAEAKEHNEQGTRAYAANRLDDARTQFELAVAASPDSAEAHYNLGLALFSMGQGQEARDQFIQAANLAPGNKVIWDSPALRPFGSPDPSLVSDKKDPGHNNNRPAFGGIGPRN